MLLDDFSAKPEYAVGVRPGILPKADCIACTAIIIVNKIIPISAIKKTREIWQLYIEEIKAVGLGHLRFINFARVFQSQEGEADTLRSQETLR